ncbi:hypothetical protein VPG91_01270 [Nitrospirillum amazonense]|uniref:hypothetical protein n=1 Tax=Nitrospirillum amazonense TaxID=28077 RepID=UPI002DD444E6|nr:hypothetical protein [Nitrospirillum amazonense]MEC4589604.1 hypothetical protein [Nitrospirillum amazonense]
MAQQAAPPASTAAAVELPYDRPDRLIAGDFVGEIHAYEAAAAQEAGYGAMRDSLAMQFARLGRPELASIAWKGGPGSIAWKRKHSADCDEAAGGVAADPLETLLSWARDRRVVMINENHIAPASRAFWLAALPRLRQMGFTHVAMEALFMDGGDVKDGEVREHWMLKGNPTFAPYLSEPTFAAVIRKALALGFDLVPYDDLDVMSDDPDLGEASRERVEAARLANVLARMPPDGKLLVLAGWGHVDKGIHKDVPWMAEVFKRRTGIDPLTVDTTACQRPDATSATTYLNPDGSARITSSQVGRVDLQVHMPSAVGADPVAAAGISRHWLGRPVAIPAALLPRGGDGVVEARKPGQPADTAPYDRLFLRKGEVLPLYLPPGRYVLTLRGEGGGIQASASLTVAAPPHGKTPATELSQANNRVAPSR